jgi:hypothetical protein
MSNRFYFNLLHEPSSQNPAEEHLESANYAMGVLLNKFTVSEGEGFVGFTGNF